MDKYRCIPCDYEYDPAKGAPEGRIPVGAAFEDLPEDWECPICSVDKDQWYPVQEGQQLSESDQPFKCGD